MSDTFYKVTKGPKINKTIHTSRMQGVRQARNPSWNKLVLKIVTTCHAQLSYLVGGFIYQ